VGTIEGSLMRVLITGAGGQVGHELVSVFGAGGHEVAGFDHANLDITNRDAVRVAVVEFQPDVIVHSAAWTAVDACESDPDRAFAVNAMGTRFIVEASRLVDAAVHYISTDYVFDGTKDSAYVEWDQTNPQSVYGASKLAAEGEVNKFLAIPGNHGTSLRFFNVVGTAAPELLDNSVENLVPIVINKLKAGQPPVIYGTDYPTHDGTCVRDYVDVRDIAGAHLAAADFKGVLPLAMNVGTGVGGSVREVIKLVCEAAGRNDVIATETSRRSGDPAFLCADVSLIKSVIGFSSKYSLEESTKTLS
jgi:UDP-glucose 4-epimerase